MSAGDEREPAHSCAHVLSRNCFTHSICHSIALHRAQVASSSIRCLHAMFLHVKRQLRMHGCDIGLLASHSYMHADSQDCCKLITSLVLRSEESACIGNALLGQSPVTGLKTTVV